MLVFSKNLRHFYKKLIKPLFPGKINSVENNFSDELGEMIKNKVEFANIFNTYFVNVVPSISITNNHNFLSSTCTSDNPLEKIIAKYQNHLSITCINKHMANSEFNSTFQLVTKNQISKFIKLLNDKQAVQSIDIPIKLIKEFCEFFSGFTYKSISHFITKRNFIADFKEAEFRQL